MENKNDKLEQLLKEAQELFSADKAELIPILLNGWFGSGELKDSNISNRYYKLIAFGYLKKKQLFEAEEASLKFASHNPDDIDYYFIKALIHYSLREFKPALDVIDQYYNLYKTDADNSAYLTAANKFQSRLFNLAGLANFQLGHNKLAYDSFVQAINLDDTNQNCYINLFHYYEKQDSINEALEILEQGIGKCDTDAELKLLKMSFSRKQTIPSL